MEKPSYTIKDIARLAGVSAGTVDRVLHNRGDVSPKSREKVQKVLDEIDYQPNIFAIGLAAKKKYTLTCVIPYYVEHDYWHSVVLGIERAHKELHPFNITVNYLYYEQGNETSYREVFGKVQESGADGILLAPNFREQTLTLLAWLQEKQIPYAFIDFNMEQAGALTYSGQDSYQSGYLTAKILMRNYSPEQELVLFLSNNKENPGEIQMQRRMNGFMQYIAENHDRMTIHDVILNKANPDQNKQVLEHFFNNHPKATLGVVFNSRVYQVGNFLKETGRKMNGLIGYDLLKDNVSLLQSGHVHYLIGQRPALQGYCGIKALCNHVVFKKAVAPIKYMPIDILMKENIEYYFEFE